MINPLFPPCCLVVVGLAAEAAVLPRGMRVLCSGGDPARLVRLLAEQRPLPAAVLSFGIAGGLAPHLPSGRLIVAIAIAVEDARHRADAAWARALVAATGAAPGLLTASATVVGTAAAKRALYRRTGALAVDMESGVAAAFAQAHGLPFAALRAIADPAGDALPPAATVGLHPDGTPAPGRVFAALLRRPQDLPGLLRIAWQSRRALAALRLALARAGA